MSVMSTEPTRPKIYVCTNMRGGAAVSCGGQGSKALARAIRAYAEGRGISVDIEETVCLGRCQDGPNVRIHGGAFFQRFSEQDMDALFQELASNA